MVVANHAGDLPLPVLVSPQMNEFRLSDIVGLAGVVGVEQFSVQSLNLVEKGIGRGDGLRVGARERRSKQGGENEGG